MLNFTNHIIMHSLVSILVPIFICCILPVSIVLIIARGTAYGVKKRAEVLMKAIEYNPDLDVDSLARSMMKPPKTFRQILSHRLLCGCIYTLLGVFTAIGCIILEAMYSEEIITIILIFATCIFLPIGLGYLITWAITRKDNTEKEASE